MSGLRKLSVITWNIWFDQLEREIRYEEILKICESLNPDVVCLQEVIPEFLDKVKSNPFFTKEYSFSDSNLNGSTMEGYGVLVMCKKELNAKCSIIKLPTIYGRKLVVAEVHRDDDVFAVGSVHMESLSNHPTREKQMEICNSILTQYSHSLLCGDFNFCSYSNYRGAPGPLENESLLRIMPEYIDVWSQLRPDSRGLTFDTQVNPMIGNREERMRYDRIVYRSKVNSDEGGNMWTAKTIGILGDSPIKKSPTNSILNNSMNISIWSRMFRSSASRVTTATGSPEPTTNNIMVNVRGQVKMVPLFPSDHFGLYAEFESC